MTAEEKYFLEENLVSQREIISEDGKYSLTRQSYKIGTPEDHYWNYTRGIVKSIDTGQVLCDVKRNYSSFWHFFLKHPNGSDYFLAGENYHGGYNIFDLTNGKEYKYNPVKTSEYQSFFCWVDVIRFREEEQQLVIEGCYWGGVFEEVTFDFSDPSIVPLPEINRRDIEDGDE